MQALTQGLIQRRLDSFSTPVVPSASLCVECVKNIDPIRS